MQDLEQVAKALVEDLTQKAETLATRKASQNTLEVLKPAMPELLGGSADLTGSNLTMAKVSRAVMPGVAEAGNHIFYGVREFGMCAIMNGIALHGGFVPYGGTFLVFSDYARNALRMAALTGAGRSLRSGPTDATNASSPASIDSTSSSRRRPAPVRGS